MVWDSENTSEHEEWFEGGRRIVYKESVVGVGGFLFCSISSFSCIAKQVTTLKQVRLLPCLDSSKQTLSTFCFVFHITFELPISPTPDPARYTHHQTVWFFQVTILFDRINQLLPALTSVYQSWNWVLDVWSLMRFGTRRITTMKVIFGNTEMLHLTFMPARSLKSVAGHLLSPLPFFLTFWTSLAHFFRNISTQCHRAAWSQKSSNDQQLPSTSAGVHLASVSNDSVPR